ncbi:unnamed protein product [Lupinus luteus]|uniref:F-box protein n=1 Tax=Lupinus luteus TaxID=3873 RepID=A0AAV1YFB9_LUPLU
MVSFFITAPNFLLHHYLAPLLACNTKSPLSKDQPSPWCFQWSGNSSSSLSSTLFKGKLYVFGIYTCFVSSFDLEKHVWSDVQTIRPHGVVFSFLVSCRRQLVLARICNLAHGSYFNLWKVDERTMEFIEIEAMPRDLLYDLFDADEDDKFASLKCVGLGDLIYVFNEDYHRVYPACVCEIDGESGKCCWRRVPQMPLPVNKNMPVSLDKLQSPSSTHSKDDGFIISQFSPSPFGSPHYVTAHTNFQNEEGSCSNNELGKVRPLGYLATTRNHLESPNVGFVGSAATEMVQPVSFSHACRASMARSIENCKERLSLE